MSKAAGLLLLACSLGACEGSSAPVVPDTKAPEPSHKKAEAAQATFGRPIDPTTPEVPLAALVDKPEGYAGRNVRTRGVVSRVCQRMGCWLELRDDARGSQLRAPMAGHAFFVPQSLVGRTAVVEGTVRVAALTDAQKAHYRSEGMQAVDAVVSLDAEAVAVTGP